MAHDAEGLERFVAAQAGVYPTALAELRAGKKRTHWMWYIFPQIAGLGFSSMAQRYAIHSRAEALAYLQHPVLGPRLRDCAEAVLSVSGSSARKIMGEPDDIKLRSSMTFFTHVSPTVSVFERVLQKYFEGAPDPKTLEFLQRDTADPA